MHQGSSSWEITEQGSFAIGTCRVCGWRTPARRAYATVRREGVEHAAVCPGPQSATQIAEVPAALPEGAVEA